jgi:serine/threonine-protein kinase RIO1
MSTTSISPWAVTTPVVTKTLADIMSEELVANEFSVVTGQDNTEAPDYVYNEEDFMTPEELSAKRLAEELASQKLAEELASTAHVTPATEDFVFNEDDFLTIEEKADRDFAIALGAQEEENARREKAPKYGNSKVSVCSSLDEHYLYGSGDGASQHIQVSSENFAAEELGAKLMGHAGSSGVCFRNGVANVDGTRVSKHDGLIDGLMNSMSLGEMDGSGDMSGLMVSNTVSNSLKSFSQKQKQKGVYVGGGRVSTKDSRSTSEAVLDETTRLLLFKLIQKNVFDEVHGIIKTGKESNVYHATKNKTNTDSTLAGLRVDENESYVGGEGYVVVEKDVNNCDVEETASSEEVVILEESDSKVETGSVASSEMSHLIFENSDLDCHDVAVKVFKTTLNEFSNRIDYIKGDHRFSREKYAKNSNNKRKFIAQVGKTTINFQNNYSLIT